MKINISAFYEKHKKGFKLALVASSTLAMVCYRSYMMKHLYMMDRSLFSVDMDDISSEDLKEGIYSSEKLSDREKEFLYNEEFLEDILPYVNDSNAMKYVYQKRFNDIDIIPFGSEDKLYGIARGYYTGSNKIYIKDYDDTDTDNRIYNDTIPHEYVHLCEYSLSSDFVLEPVAEMMSYEYFGYEPKSYLKEIKLLKELMEIIGSKPILTYAFSGDFSLIEERVKPYLNDDEYKLFEKCIKTRMDYDNGHKSKDYNINYIEDTLEPIYDTLYKNIYGEDIETNPIITEIRTDRYMVRYYFNNRLGEEYYWDRNNLTLESMPVAEMNDDGVWVVNEYVFNLPTKVYIDPISTVEDVFSKGISK